MLKVSIYYRDLIAKIKIFRKVLGHLLRRATLPCATDMWVRVQVAPTWRAVCVGAASPATDLWGPRGDVEKNEKGQCAREGSNPRRADALPRSLTTGPARGFVWIWARWPFGVDLGVLLNLTKRFRF